MRKLEPKLFQNLPRFWARRHALRRNMPHSPTAASSYLQPGPFVPIASPPSAVDAEVRRLLEQLRPHTERLLALFKEWDDDGGKITRKQFALTVQLLHQQVWLEAPAGSRTTQAPPARVLLGCFDLVDRAKVSPTLTPTHNPGEG